MSRGDRRRAASREYTARGQLELVQDGSGQQLVHYHYFRDGKVDSQDYANGTTTVFGYDGRGLTSSVWHKKNGSGQNLSYRDIGGTTGSGSRPGGRAWTGPSTR